MSGKREGRRIAAYRTKTECWRRVSAITAGLVLSLATVEHARAAGPTSAQCVDANESAQTLRQEKKLQAARQKLLLCIAKSCPSVVRDDCAERLNDLERAAPTIVITAKAHDKDVTEVRVSVDGAVLAERLDGSALAVDPGAHVFVFEAQGYPAVTKSLVIAEGVKGRTESVVFGEQVSKAAPVARLVLNTGASSAITIDGSASGSGRFEGSLPAGKHKLRVTEPGKKAYDSGIDLRPGETRTLEITLENERRTTLWPWIVGGVAAAAAVSVGGYFLFRPADASAPPTGTLGSVTLALGAR